MNDSHRIKFARPGTPMSPESSFDIRIAAASYSNISALLAGFAFTAITLVITLIASSPRPPAHDELRSIEFAIGLFGVSFVGNTAGSFAYAALSGGKLLTPRMFGAGYIQGITASVGACSVFGGMSVLAGEFLPSRQIAVLFGVATLVGGTAAVFLMSWNASDTLRTCGPPNRLRHPTTPRTEADIEVVEALESRRALEAVALMWALSVPAFFVPVSRSYPAIQQAWVALGGLIALGACLGSIAYSNPRGTSDGRLSMGFSRTMQLIVALYVVGLVNLLPVQVF